VGSEVQVSVVIPVYRSEKYLAKTVHELVQWFEPRVPFEIVLVNDGSPDDVQSVIVELARDARVRFVESGRNQGQHAAILLGFRMTRGRYVLTLDDDGQNPPEAGQAVLDALDDQKYDVVYGRFESTEQTLFRVAASRLNRLLSGFTIGNQRGIAVSNVRALRGDLARALGRAAPPHPYIEALVFRATRRIGQVGVSHRARGAGESTYSLSTLLKLWVSHLTTLTALPLKAATVGSFLVSLVGFAIGVQQVVTALMERRAPAGWLSLFCAVTLLFSVLFAFLGIISLYLGRMYVAQNERGLDWIRSSSGDRDDRPA
jgi:undecaprenyl-phosphate 4-deoxy-4-formamido-L-arabinose transferase